MLNRFFYHFFYFRTKTKNGCCLKKILKNKTFSLTLMHVVVKAEKAVLFDLSLFQKKIKKSWGSFRKKAKCVPKDEPKVSSKYNYFWCKLQIFAKVLPWKVHQKTTGTLLNVFFLFKFVLETGQTFSQTKK